MAHLSAQSRALVYSGLEKYARSGMGMEKAAESLLDQSCLSRGERKIYTSLLQGLRNRKSIADALASAGSVVSPLEHEIVAAAESGGQLEKGFSHLKEYFRRLDRTQRALRKGLAYPLFLLHFAVPVTFLAAGAFRNIRFDGDPPSPHWMRDALISSGGALLALWIGGLIVFLLVRRLQRAGVASATLDRLLYRVPLVGRARKALALERFTHVFEIFLLAGRTMSDSFAGAARASGSGVIQAAARRGTAALVAGEPLAEVMDYAPDAFPRDLVRGVTAAEESGQLDREFAEWGQFYSESVVEAMDKLGEWLPKLFYWGTLLVVAAMIIRAALAYRDLLTSLLNFSG